MDWLPSVLGFGSAKRGSLLLAVWVFAYVSRTLFAWHGPLPLELGISSLASVVLAVHRKNVHSYQKCTFVLALCYVCYHLLTGQCKNQCEDKFHPI